jgi:preprotein translocase subunit YajC
MNMAHAAELAYAQTSGGGGGSAAIFTQVAFFAAIFAIFYFLLIRPQQKQRREREQMLAAVKKGDRVVTTSGIHGTVTGLSDQTVIVRVADNVKLEFDRAALGRIVERTAGDRDA